MADDYKIECQDVWKLFGDGADRWLASLPSPPQASQLAESDYVGAVRAASFAVKEGETFVIMGLSGSGKSTLVRCLSRLIEPTGGRIFFEGLDFRALAPKELMQIRRHKMGMVFQHFALLPHMTVLDNVSFPLEIQGQTRTDRYRRAREVIDLVGLSDRESYYPRELSGGQQQRVGIARSLAAEPDIWFLDEPFSALDPLIRREMQDEFIRLQNVLHKTIVFITHDFDEAIRLADRIAIMNDGEIIQIGTAEQLIMNPATAYVAEFTRHIPRAKVLSVATLTRPLPQTGLASATPIAADTLIESIAASIVHQTEPIAVCDDHGAINGALYPADVRNVLAGAITETNVAGPSTPA